MKPWEAKAWGLTVRIIDALFGAAISVCEWRERRAARRRFSELVAAKGRDEARAVRARADTVILPRPGPVTSRPPEAPGDSPTAPTRPGRGR